ncbi:MAG: DUF4038 domain-containing protein [Verrucomicrobiales bacterium]|nr:DUF4038 domain-containing protein [Verrucomicrobiales bacterium]
MKRPAFPVLLAILCLPVIAPTAKAIQAFEHAANPKQANQWEVIDIRFPVANLPDHPEDLSLTAELTSGAGSEVVRAAGFYDGDKTCLLRFTAPAEGEWTYRTTSSVDELNGLTGELVIDAPKPGRKGGIRIDPEAPRNFRYDNGDPYYPICYEVDWLFALDAENSDDIPKTRQCVASMAENGFNQVIMNVFADDVTWKKDEGLEPEHEYGSPRVFPFGGTNSAPDHSRLNIGYFQRLDRVIEHLNDEGIAAHLMIYVWNKKVSWPEADSPEDNRYFDYVVKRYQGFPNLVWDISKEVLGYGHNDASYITRRIERLRKLDLHHRLVTVHDYGYCRKSPQQVDFISVQLWSSELHRVMLKVRSEFEGKPVLNIEHGGYERSPYVVFEGNYSSSEVCLERAWQCVFAGTYPTHYWQGAAWNAVIPDIKSLPPEQRPKLEYYRHMREFVERYHIESLKPGDKKSGSGFLLHDGKSLGLFYVPKENDSIGLQPNAFPGKTLTATWFDPFTGVYDALLKKPAIQWQSFTKPDGDGFRILIIEATP